MRKFLILILLVSIGLVFADEKENTGAHFVQCYKCKSAAVRMRGYAGCTGCPAWRRYDLEKGQHEHMVYKCQHGHTLYLSYQGDKKE